MNQGVNAHHICGPEGSRFGATQYRPCKCIHLIDRQFHFLHGSKQGHDAVQSNPIGDEAWRVFAKHCGLSKKQVSVMHEKINHPGSCMDGWYDFQQTQVTGGIEKMCSTKMLLKIFRPSFCHHVDGNS